MILLPVLLPFLGGLFLLVSPTKNLSRYCYSVLSLTAIAAVALPFLNLAPLTLGYFPMNATLTFFVDEISLFFSWIFVLIWICVLRYSFGYLEGDPKQKRFFAFYLAALGAMIGVSYAQNLITLYMCFECVTLTCFPLIAHSGTEESFSACKKYIFYSLAGALMGLIAVFYFYSLGVDTAFTAGGIAGLADAAPLATIQGFFALGVIGFGCKAGLFPLQGWLKTAHPIAPAPASAVLSGITTKAGVIAILRMLYYVVGVHLIAGSAVQLGLLAVTLLTIFLGSMLAYREKIFKTRLAYSTVSQVSYVLFALLLCNEIAFVGALLHVLFHALAKTTLFLSAGTVIHQTGHHRVDELSGLGVPLQRTFLLFTVAGLSLVGVPFFGGFVSKWYIAIGALSQPLLGSIGVGIIMISALLTAGYLLSISLATLMPNHSQELVDCPPAPSCMTSPTLAVLTVVLGVYPAPIIAFVAEIAAQIL